MAYITYQELLLRYPLVESWGGESETDVASGLIYYAEEELHRRMGTHFAVPFDNAHPAVKDLTIDLSYYRTLRQADPEKAEQIHDSIIGRIEGFKKGDELIITGSGTSIRADSSVGQNRMWSNTGSWHPVFGMSDYAGGNSVVSSGMLDYEEDQRD